MQRTEKFFEQDAYHRTAQSRILAAEAKQTGRRITLDGNVAYPEGGGQPANRGTLTLSNGPVL